MQTVAEFPRVGLAPEVAAAKHNGQRERILEMLKAAGEAGCTSEQLNRVAFRYASVIHRLRQQDGHVIETQGRQGTELARYIYKGKLEGSGQISLC